MIVRAGGGWRSVAAALVAAAIAWPSGVATAEVRESETSCCAAQFVIEAHYRLRSSWLSDFSLDNTGYDQRQTVIGEQRLRVDPWVAFGDRVFLRSQADLFSGQIFGDRSSVGADFLLLPRDEYEGLWRFDPRQLWLEWRAPFGRVVAGQLASHWGLGVLANDGADRGLLFGERRHGDLVERLAIAVPPAALFTDAAWARRLVLAAGFDVVFRDENASLVRGDLAMQAVVSLSWQAPTWTLGAYVVYRDQEDDDGSELQATVIDVFARWRIPLGTDETALELAFEGVVVTGHTDRAQPERSPGGMDVLGFGAVLRTSLEWPDAGIFPALELGFASGDNDRGDATNRAFSFDPDYRVGLILFDQVLARMSARAADRAADPERAAVPPDGLRWLPTNGSVTNAFYLHATLAYRPTHWLALHFGLLYALAPADVIDPYASAERGGYNTTYLGGSGGRSLGVEIDAAAVVTLAIEGAFTVRLALEAGVFFAGDALDGADVSLEQVYTVRGGLDVLW